MSLPFKIKKMATSVTDSSFLIDEVVSSIAKIKKQKQRPNTERIFSMMVKSHPELTLPCLNDAIEKAIQDGLVVNYLHNGVYSYRVVPTSSESASKFISDRSVEDSVKWLFCDGKSREFNVDDLESSVKQHFPAGSLFSSCLRDVILNTCSELVQLGELTYAKGVYIKSTSGLHDEKDFKHFGCINNNNIRNDSITSMNPKGCIISKKTEPPDIENDRPNDKFVKIKSEASHPTNSEDLKISDDTHISSKESFSNLQSPLSDVSSDKPKKKKARSLQVSFLYDSLSNFFSVSGERRRTCRSLAEKSINSDASQDSKSSRQSAARSGRISKVSRSAPKAKSNKITKKKPKPISKNGKILQSTKSNHQSHSINIQKTPFMLHSTLDELDLNEVNLASFNNEDQDFFANVTTLMQESSANHPIELAYGRFLLLVNNTSVLSRMASRCKRLVMCEFCLQILESSRSLERHLMKCGLHCPPGSEMYRFNDIKLFHLATRDQVVYCKRLDQLIRLLCSDQPSHLSMEKIPMETSTKDISTLPSCEELNYFILTIQDRSGSHLAGILSYHNQKEGHWTVTCLFVMPQYRNQGHAKCLVSLVYRMASLCSGEVILKLDIPLKNHVLNLFQSVWRSLIIDYLINIEAQTLHFQLEDIANATSIELKDVISTLSSLKMESDFYLTEQAVDMTHSQKEEMRRGLESHLLLSGLELSFGTKCCRNLEEVLKGNPPSGDNLDVSTYQERHALIRRGTNQSLDVRQRLWNMLSSLGMEADSKICNEPSVITKKRKLEEVSHDDDDDDDDDNDDINPNKKFHQSNDEDASHHEVEVDRDIHTEPEQDKALDGVVCHHRVPLEDSSVGNEISNMAFTPKDSRAIGENNFEDREPGELRRAERSEEGEGEEGMPSLDDQVGSPPSTTASSVGVATSSPSPPDLGRENKDEVTVVSSVRSDHSEVDVGGPTCSPVKGSQGSLPSSVKNVSSFCSMEEDRCASSIKNGHEDDDCTVVAIETAPQDPRSSSSCAEMVDTFNNSSSHYHGPHHGNMDGTNADKGLQSQTEQNRNFCGDVAQYSDDVPKEYRPTTSYFTPPNRQDSSYSRQCQSVTPGSCKSGKSKKSSKQDDDAGFCAASGERTNNKFLPGGNSMQERCNSVFVDTCHYPSLPFNQGPGNNQLFQRPLDYIDGRVERPATRCGFESSFSQPFNPEFTSRFVSPHPPNLETVIGYQMQDCTLQTGCVPGLKSNQPSNFGGNRSQHSAISKTNKRSSKSQGVVPPPACYASTTKASNALTNSPTIGGTLPMPSEPFLNAIYRFPNMTQGFEIPGSCYGLPNRFSSESNKSNFAPPNSYFNHQSSPPGACQIQSQHNPNQSHPHHVNRGNNSNNNNGNNNNGSTSEQALHHRPVDEPHQQALLLQHQRQQSAAYLTPAAYWAKLHFASEFGQFQYPAPFHSSSSPTPIDMSLHVPTRPSAVDGKASLLGMQQHRDSFPEVDLFQSYKMLNLSPYAGSVDPRNIVHRNSQNQMAVFGHQQQAQLDPSIQYSAYLNGANRMGNDLFANSNIGDLMRK